jgi:hypothetical protein
VTLQVLAGLPHQNGTGHHDPSQPLGPVTRVAHHLRVSAPNRDADFLVMQLAKWNREIACVFATPKVMIFDVFA